MRDPAVARRDRRGRGVTGRVRRHHERRGRRGPSRRRRKSKGPRGITATTIRVGGLGDALLYGGADIGARARFQRANADGGVNGRTIDYVGFRDDGGDPASDTAAAAALARPGGVFAVVPTVAPDLAGASVLVKRQVPYFGWALSSNFCGTALGFGFTGCQASSGSTSNVWGLLVRQAFGPGPQSTGKTAAILTESTPSGEYELRALKAGLASARLTVVSGASSLPVPAIADYSGIVGGVLTSAGGHQPDSVFVVGSASSVLGVQQALRAASYVGVFTNVLEYDPNLVAPAGGAFVAIQTAATETAPQNPAMQQLITDVQKVAPDQPIDQAVVAGYFSADLFLDAVRKAGKHLTVGRPGAGGESDHLPRREHGRPDDVPGRARSTNTVRLVGCEQRRRVHRARAVHVRQSRCGQVAGDAARFTAVALVGGGTRSLRRHRGERSARTRRTRRPHPSPPPGSPPAR